MRLMLSGRKSDPRGRVRPAIHKYKKADKNVGNSMSLSSSAPTTGLPLGNHEDVHSAQQLKSSPAVKYKSSGNRANVVPVVAPSQATADPAAQRLLNHDTDCPND